jgi:hypothetical protein
MTPSTGSRQRSAADLVIEKAPSEVLGRRGVDGDELHAAVWTLPADLTSAPAEDVLSDARDRYDVADPTTAQILTTVFSRPDPQIRAAFAALGVATEELAYEYAAPDRPTHSNLYLLLQLVDILFAVLGSVALVYTAAHDHRWWQLGLIVFFWGADAGWWGWALAGAVVLGLTVGWPFAAFVAGSLVTTAVQDLVGRRDAFLDTGVWLSMRRWRSVRRWTNPRLAVLLAARRRAYRTGGSTS